MGRKINGKTIDVKEFAYDGCHKMYLLESEVARQEALDCEYEILPIKKLPKIYAKSDSLKFISDWDTGKQYAKQGENCAFSDF